MSAVTVLPNSMTFASFGAEQTGRPFSARSLLDGQRYQQLDRRQSYYDATCYDGRAYDFDGRVIGRSSLPGMSATQPLLSQAQVPYYVPLAARRPSSPYRLARVIVNAYTTLLFGENRFPHIRVLGDKVTQDFLQAICRVGRLPIQMIRARNLGGSMGSVGLGWCFKKGKPQFSVHNAKNVYIAEWEDREALVPARVTECFQFYRDEWDPARRRIQRNWYWYRRDWTKDADLVFPEIPVKSGEEPRWQEPDPERSNFHNDGVLHFEWIQNFPAEDVDGVPDYEGLYENFEAIDQLYSVITRGSTLNLDPTLVLKVDTAKMLALGGIRKGSDNALTLDKDGSAEYLALGGESVDAGLKLFDSMRRAALEVAQCIVPDPGEVAAQGVSSVAIKTMYAPMLARVEVLQEQYGQPLERMLSNIVQVGKMAGQSRVTVLGDDGAEEEVALSIDLPPKVEISPILDAEGKPTGEDRVVKVQRGPGDGGEVQTVWPPRFQATPSDLNSVAQTMATATGGKPFMSRQSAVETASKYFGIDPDEEWKRVEQQHATDREQAESMFQGAAEDSAGAVSHELELPGGARIRKMAEPKSEEPGAAEVPEVPSPPETEQTKELSLAPADLANIVTVNEARAAAGLGPIADGDLTIVEFKAKKASLVARAAAAEKGTDPDDPKPTAAPFHVVGNRPPFPPKA